MSLLARLLEKTAERDACYYKVKKAYRVWPSARASQALAKCRKAAGDVRKGKAGANLRRWERERWIDTRTGKPCGAGGANEYCRPSKRVSAATPKTQGELTRKELKLKQREKARVGMGARVTNV